MNGQSAIHHQFLYRGFVPLLTLFVGYVSFGYYSAISTATQLPLSAVIAIITVIMAIIYFFARHTAISIQYARAQKGLARFTWLPVFLFLFMFSGFGFISSSMLLFEGPTVVRDTLDVVIRSLSTLGARASTSLLVRDYDDMVNRVNGELKQLKIEIYSPSQGHYCGIGRRAKEILHQIKQDLPSIDVIAGTDVDHSCSNQDRLDGINKAYTDSIRESLVNSPLYIANRVPQRYALKDSLARDLQAEINRLLIYKRRIGSTPTFITDFDLYKESVAQLEEGKAVYEDSYQKLLSLVPAEVSNLPPKVDIAPAEKISSAFQMITTLLSRFDRLTTYLYIFIALVFDGLVTYAGSVVVLKHKEFQDLAREVSLGGSDVSYIWRPAAPESIPAARNSLQPTM